jgi:hypothetical protein
MPTIRNTEKTMTNELEELKSQVGLAVAALGVSFARTLAEDDVPPRVLATLRQRSEEAHRHLQDQGALHAAEMFAQFAQALHDPRWFPQRPRR